MHAVTKDDLLQALHGEAFAYAKYMLFSRRATTDGHPEIARLFEKIAEEELSEHFREFSELYNLVGTTEENLRSAIDGEEHEVTTLYISFEEETRAVGDMTVANRFEEVRRDEVRHLQSCRDALRRLA